MSVVGWHAHAYRRMWRGTITVSFLNPIFFLVSIGVLLGTLVDRLRPRPRRAHVPRVRRAGARRGDRDADGGERDDVPGQGRPEVAADVPRGRRDARPRPGARHRGRRLGRRPGRRRRARCSRSSQPSAGRSPRRSRPFAPRGAALRARVRGRARGGELGTDADQWLVAIFRFGLVPLFLFSGTFFPISQLPDWLEPLAWVTPLWHGVELCRGLATGDIDGPLSPSTSRTSSRSRSWERRSPSAPARRGSAMSTHDTALRILPRLPLGTHRSWRLVERNLTSSRDSWLVFVSGFFEPLFYLLALGVGVGRARRRPRPRRRDRLLPRVRRPRAPRGVGDERRRLRVRQRLLQAEVREDVRGRARDAADGARRRGRRAHLHAAARDRLRDGLRRRDARPRPDRLAVGGARRARRFSSRPRSPRRRCSR